MTSATPTTTCPTCSTPITVGYRVITGTDGWARRGTAAHVDSRGAACATCIDARVAKANSRDEMARKAVARNSARKHGSGRTIQGSGR